MSYFLRLWNLGDNLVTICQKMTRFPFSSFLLKSIFITWLTEEGKEKEQLTTIIATMGLFQRDISTLHDRHT